MSDRHPAYGIPVEPLYSPPVGYTPPSPVYHCLACGALWRAGHEYACPHGGTAPEGLASAPPVYSTPIPQPEGDTCFEAAALEAARKITLDSTPEDIARAKGVHTIVRKGNGKFELVSRPLVPTEMPAPPPVVVQSSPDAKQQTILVGAKAKR